MQPLFGYERSTPWPTGHRNVFWRNRGNWIVKEFRIPGGVPKNDTQLLFNRFEELNKEAITIPHTSGTSMGQDWNIEPYNPEHDRLVEIYQGDRNSYENGFGPKAPVGQERFKNGLVWNALANGFKLGFIAASDHQSTHISYACVFAEEFSRDKIYSGLKARRTFAATDKIFMDVKINGYFMGEEFTVDTKPVINVHIIGTDILDRVEIVKNNTFIYSVNPNSLETSFTYIDENPQPGEGYYYVRIIQKDEAMAWGSPLWVTYKP